MQRSYPADLTFAQYVALTFVRKNTIDRAMFASAHSGKLPDAIPEFYELVRGAYPHLGPRARQKALIDLEPTIDALLKEELVLERPDGTLKLTSDGRRIVSRADDMRNAINRFVVNAEARRIAGRTRGRPHR